MLVYLQMILQRDIALSCQSVTVSYKLFTCAIRVCVTVRVTRFAADPVLELEPLVPNPSKQPSHSSSIIMGLACNPATSPAKWTERATSTHSETLSHYYKSQRGIIWTHGILMRQLRSCVCDPLSFCCD